MSADLSQRAVAYRVVCAIAGRVFDPFMDCGFRHDSCICEKRCLAYDDLWPGRWS